MNRIRVLALAALAFLTLPLATAHAGFYVGVGYPGPYYRHHRYYRPYPYRVYVAPPPVYIAPRPVYLAPAPVIVQPAPAVIQTVPAPVQTFPVPAVPFGP